MRNMSFAMTEHQILEQSKTVTRRMGWLKLKPGDLLQPVRKGMGLKKGEKVVKLGCPIRVVQAHQEPLCVMNGGGYGFQECVLEGFPEMFPWQFIEMFCKSHKGCTPESSPTRIAFEYTNPI